MTPQGITERKEGLARGLRKGREELKERATAVKDTAETMIDARAEEVGEALHRFSGALKTASDAIESAGEQLGKRGERAAKRVESASKYLRKNDTSVFVQDIEDLSRQHVGWAMGLAFLAGAVAARLLVPGRGRD